MPMKQLAALGGVRAALRICTVPITGAPASMPELPTRPVSATVTTNSPPTVAVLMRALEARLLASNAMVGFAMSTPNRRLCAATAVDGAIGGPVQAPPLAGSADSLPSSSRALMTAQYELNPADGAGVVSVLAAVAASAAVTVEAVVPDASTRMKRR